MNLMGETRYKLAPGTQVREEDFGLLFYTMNGPRLYFLKSGSSLDADFFRSEMTLKQWLKRRSPERPVSEFRSASVQRALRRLALKGLIIEC
jgi:putative mycofactocin binding protein MftB